MYTDSCGKFCFIELVDTQRFFDVGSSKQSSLDVEKSSGVLFSPPVIIEVGEIGSVESTFGKADI